MNLRQRASVFLLGLPLAVCAHAFLDHAVPAVGSTVTVAPTAVTVWFTEAPTVVHDAIKVFDAQSRRVDRDDTHAAAGSDKALSVSLQKLTPGRYRVVWRVLASGDGHITSGNFSFAVDAGTAAVTCPLQVEHGWIRTPTPNATVLAGYAVLRDTGAAPVTITAVDSPLFRGVQIHDSGMNGGMMQMRPLASLSVAAGSSAELAPEGRHLMLSGPVRPLQTGDHVRMRFYTDGGCVVEGDFAVAATAPPGVSGSERN